MLKIFAAIATATFLAASFALLTGMTPSDPAAGEIGYGKVDSLDARFDAACSQRDWPYYEPGCVHSASGDVETRPVRVVAIDRVSSELRLAATR